MFDAIVLDGTVTLVALAVLAIEIAAIIAISAMRRTGSAASLITNALSGLFLILALRAALLDHGAGPVALFLALGGAAHLVDVMMRVRMRS